MNLGAHNVIHSALKSYCTLVTKKEVVSVLNYRAMVLQTAKGSNHNAFLTNLCEENMGQTEVCMNAEQQYACCTPSDDWFLLLNALKTFSGVLKEFTEVVRKD